MEKGEASSEEAREQRLEPLRGPVTSIRRWHDDDDDASGNYFMSEASISEAEESTEYRNHRHYTQSLLSPREGSPEGDEDLLPNVPSPPPPNPNHVAAYPSSPGTSLSSWDSPHFFPKRFQLYFSPDKSKQQGPPLTARGEESKRSKAQSPSNSASSASTNMRHRSAEFLRELKQQSVGALKDVRPEDFNDSDSNLNGADRTEVDAVIRNRGLQGLSQTRNIARAYTDQDETLVMDLSASEDDEEETEDIAESLDWEQKHLADDEKTADRPHRRRLSGKGVPGHRRSRSEGVPSHRRSKSGDGAAASLMTGGTNWKGMHIDQLPIPSSLGGHDDEDEHGEEPVVRKAASLGQNSTSPASNRTEFSSEEKGGFAIGGAPSKNVRASKRPRRNQRIRRPPPRALEQPEAARMDRDMFSGYALQPPDFVPAYVNRSSPTSLSTMEQYHSERTASDSSGHVQQTRSRSASDADLRIPTRGVHRSYSETDILQPTLEDRVSPVIFEMLDNGTTFSWISSSRPSLLSTRLSQPTWSPRESQGRYQFTDGVDGTPFDENSVVDTVSDYSRIDDDEDEEERDIYRTRLRYDPTVRELEETERLLEDKDYRGEAQHMLRHRLSPFQNVGKTAPFDSTRVSYKPTTPINDLGDYPTFLCPVCKTRQREFFTASSAPQQDQGPAGYLAFYFALYVISSLFIFGLKEGWKPLDCVYFAVITLTTAGLGDFVPTTDGAKIMCAIFIYFGVACIGLLLGSYLASMLDEKSYKEAKQNRVENCTNCARLKSIRATQRKRNSHKRESPRDRSAQATRGFMSERDSHDLSHLGPHVLEQEEKRAKSRRTQSLGSTDLSGLKPLNIGPPSSLHATKRNGRTCSSFDDKDHADKWDESERDLGVIDSYEKSMNVMSLEPKRQILGASAQLYGSPLTAQILGRQSRTRHMSFDVGAMDASTGKKTTPARPRKSTLHLISESIPENTPCSPRSWTGGTRVEESESEEDSDDESTGSETSSSESDYFADTTARRIKNAKYVFLTLKQAVVNSILIIAVGGLGFFTIEGMSAVNSFYFTTVLLTTVGYGDITPVTSAGKLFATIYVLVGGTVLLHNMSLISMIPLELRRRRIELSVLTQFGDQLDDATLRELATGPLVRNLQLHSYSTTGLEECTRETFALAMLVRLGKVTETDIKQTFAAFRRLDVDNDGYLSSKSIVAGMFQKRRSTMVPPPTPPPPMSESKQDRARYWFGKRSGSLHVTTEDGDTFRFEHPDQQVPPDSEHSSLFLSDNTGYDSFGGDRRDEIGPDVERGYPNNAYQ